MMAARAVPRAEPGGAPSGSDLYRRIGDFLAEHRLSPDPGHYAFAFHVVRDAGGPLGAAVTRITDGGIRLTARDIESLGGSASGWAPTGSDAGAAPAPTDGEALAERTRDQVESFASLVATVRDEARGFGRDLQASADAIRRSSDAVAIDHVVEITRTMIERVRATEVRLEATTQEVTALREQLAEAQGSAREDALTGLPNRRAFEEAYAALVPGGRACLAICDVDWFKRINDGFGHAVGDRVLTAIGRALASGCEPHLVARYGGEEFVALMAGVTPAQGRALVDGARRAVAARRFRARDTDQPLGIITFSAGVGAIEPGEPLDEAIARVDEALYRAKAGGRNQVTPTRG